MKTQIQKSFIVHDVDNIMERTQRDSTRTIIIVCGPTYYASRIRNVIASKMSRGLFLQLDMDALAENCRNENYKRNFITDHEMQDQFIQHVRCFSSSIGILANCSLSSSNLLYIKSALSQMMFSPYLIRLHTHVSNQHSIRSMNGAFPDFVSNYDKCGNPEVFDDTFLYGDRESDSYIDAAIGKIRNKF